MKTQRQFILDTLLPYKNDPSTCGYDEEDGGCLYKTKLGQKCAVGKHIVEKTFDYKEYNGSSVDDLFYDFGDSFLTEEARKQELSVDIWTKMQNYHDNIALRKSSKTINNRLDLLEKATGLTFDELRF